MTLLPKIILFAPLISGIINGLFCRRLNNYSAALISSIFMLGSFLSAIRIFFFSGIDQNIIHLKLMRWISIGTFTIDWSIYVDQLTSIMFLLVTAVSFVVHIYSLGYMKDDDNLPKFLSYLSLFTFFMLALVSGDNFLQVFFGWEGVGLCSYLLIGYYFTKESANKAAVKAFVVNRVGDFAFIIGMVTIFLLVESLEFKAVFTQAKSLSERVLLVGGYNFSILDFICFMLFLGCMGKSAQIGMHVWLPDAMEGPTPVSALIHAATMVTAGVFLLARCSFLYEYSPIILQLITIIGSVTCLFAAMIAIAQNDIKKIIAYSTCSQLGYMFFSCGVSAYQAGIFHLVTHGFFKALLFLSAGSVIHAVHEQDIFKMGGLRKKMPITYANFWMGSLAIIGVFPFAGFYSKDIVLESSFVAIDTGRFAFYLGIMAALLTAIYSLKIIVLTFHGETRLDKDVFSHAHESPNIMNLPLIILLAGTIFSGMIGHYILDIANPNGYFLGAIFNINYHAPHVELIIKLMPLIVGVSGMIIGIILYRNISTVESISRRFGMVYYILKNKFFFDEIYNQIFVNTTMLLSRMSKYVDMYFIDQIGPGFAEKASKVLGRCISNIQTGYLHHYAILMIVSLIICITLFIMEYLPTILSM